MRLLLVTDLHGRADVLEEILGDAAPADVILLGGDLTNFGSTDDAERIVQVAQRSAPEVLAVAGNCDSIEIDQRLAQLGVALMGRGREIGDIGFCGVSAMPPWHGSMYELTEDEIAAALEEGHRQIETAAQLVVLAHPPPQGTTLDRTSTGTHPGSTALREFIAQREPNLVVCGHIHEARGTEQIGSSLVVNCGPAFRGCFAVAELADDAAGSTWQCKLLELPG